MSHHRRHLQARIFEAGGQRLAVIQELRIQGDGANSVWAAASLQPLAVLMHRDGRVEGWDPEGRPLDEATVRAWPIDWDKSESYLREPPARSSTARSRPVHRA